MKLKVLILGGGGREAALVWKLSQSPLCGRIFALPGNPGMLNRAELVQGLDMADLEALTDWCGRKQVDLVVVGPEQPLVAGAVDVFRERGLRSFGPEGRAARLEGSKSWAKDFMRRHGVASAEYRCFDELEPALAFLKGRDWEPVIKADGLAAGKGVLLPGSLDEAEAALRSMMQEDRFGEAGRRVVIEERLEGPELSVFAICDGERAWTLASARDYKRALKGDRGPNTGGMGALSPSPDSDAALLRRIESEILRPVVEGMQEEGCPYRGILYLGLMLCEGGPRVIEFNCRFGDPETQAVLPLLDVDLLGLMWEVASGGSLPGWRILQPAARAAAAHCLVLASGGYPGACARGLPIQGLDRVEDALVFHAGTATDAEGRLVTAGGRVLNLVGLGATPAEARERSYRAAERVSFEGMFYRPDIGA